MSSLESAVWRALADKKPAKQIELLEWLIAFCEDEIADIMEPEPEKTDGQ